MAHTQAGSRGPRRVPFSKTVLAYVYLFLSVLLLSNTIGVVAPRRYGQTLGMLGAVPFIVLMMGTPHILLLGFGLTAWVALVGALHTLPGQLGLALHVIAWILLIRHLIAMQTACPIVDGRPVGDTGPVFPEESHASKVAISYLPYLRYRTPAMSDVMVERSVIYREVSGRRLRVDIYRPRQSPAPPGVPLQSIIYIHGGGWVIGTRQQSRFMMFELAAAGYTVFAIQYRLAPRFPLPAAIEDAKAAVAWVREHGGEYGGTPDAVVVGGSAGAHLASMVALSPDEKAFQPGFESADTSVRAAILLYGFYDLIGRLESQKSVMRWHWFFERVIFSESYKKHPQMFQRAQPFSHVSPQAPPTLFIHGQNDSLVPITDSQRLHHELKVVGARTHLCEVPLAQHAFEIVPSPLHQRTLRVMLHFLRTI